MLALVESGDLSAGPDQLSWLRGAKFDRKGIDELLRTARAGDTITVTFLDRLGRSLSQVVSAADDLAERGIIVKSLKESIDYSTSVGRMLAGIFASLAEYERELINERVADARAAARARGQQTDRPPALTEDHARQLRSLHAAGESVVSLAKAYEISRPTVYRVLEGAV